MKGTYQDELEFLWKRFPDNAVYRRKDTGKWYGAMLTISKQKLGLDSSEKVVILDLLDSARRSCCCCGRSALFPRVPHE